MGVTVEIEIGEICNRVGGAARCHLARPYEAPEALSHFNVREVQRMELVLVSTERAQRRQQEKFEQGRSVDDDHADSRSSRMTTAAGVFKVTRFRP